MSFGNQSQLTLLYGTLMTDDYGPLVECEVLGKILLQCQSPTCLSEVRNHQLIVGLVVVGYQFGY